VGVHRKSDEGDSTGIPDIVEAFGFRTARLLMSGTAYYRGNSPQGGEES
jgi:hypothetical protein